MENKELFFTTGELAKLTGLSKQLLIFYDKKNFLLHLPLETMAIVIICYLGILS